LRYSDWPAGARQQHVRGTQRIGSANVHAYHVVQVIRYDHKSEDRPPAPDGCSFQMLDRAVVVYVTKDSMTLIAARINMRSRIWISNARRAVITTPKLTCRQLTTTKLEAGFDPALPAFDGLRSEVMGPDASSTGNTSCVPNGTVLGANQRGTSR
jgi:hypothetical protein